MQNAQRQQQAGNKRKRTTRTGTGAAAQPPAKRAAFGQAQRPQAPPRARAVPYNAAAAAYALGQLSGEPQIVGSFRSTRIRHRELVASVAGTAAWTTAIQLSLNPGLAATFPWLSTQAQGWEQYRFHKLRACYYTRCATSTPGSMMLIPDYDAADAAPSSEQIASSYRDVTEEVPWVVEASCRLDPSAMHEMGRRKFIRTGTLAANLDVKTYDAGTFFVGTTDGSATNWGKLWLEYDVELFVPQLPPAGISGDEVISGQTAISNTQIFGTAPVTTGSVVLATAAVNTVTILNPGSYFLSLRVAGTGTPVVSVSGTAPAAGGIGPTQSGTTGAGYTASFTTTAPNQTVVYTVTNVVTSANLVISQMTAAQAMAV